MSIGNSQSTTHAPSSNPSTRKSKYDEALGSAGRKQRDWLVKLIEFDGEDFTPLNLLKLPKELLGPPPDEKKM